MTSKEVQEYIDSSLKDQKTKEEIYSYLLNNGVSLNTINTTYKNVDSHADKEQLTKRVITFAVYAGAFLVGLGIFIFIATNWRSIGDYGKVTIILLSMFASYIAGWIFKFNLNLNHTGDAFIVLGSIIYGAGLFLIGEIFDIKAIWPDGFILWMVGLLVMAHAMKSKLMHSLAVIAGFSAAVGYPFIILESFADYSPYLFTSTLLLVFATIITFLNAQKLDTLNNSNNLIKDR